jgi:hypothetical protein
MDLEGHTFVVATGPGPGSKDLASALGAGADDFIKKPIAHEELLARVAGRERIRRWASRLFFGRAPKAWLDPRRPDALRAWRTAGHDIAHDLAALVGHPLTVRSVPDPLGQLSFGAEIALSLPLEELEVRIGVALDTATRRILSHALLGSSSPTRELELDMSRELANTAGGAFRNAAREENVELTAGLPTDLDVTSFRAHDALARQGFVLSARDLPGHLACQIDVRSRALSRVEIGDLREGMVLAGDLLNESGAVLVPAGTRLTWAQIERVRRILPRRVAVEVAEAA